MLTCHIHVKNYAVATNNYIEAFTSIPDVSTDTDKNLQKESNQNTSSGIDKKNQTQRMMTQDKQEEQQEEQQQQQLTSNQMIRFATSSWTLHGTLGKPRYELDAEGKTYCAIDGEPDAMPLLDQFVSKLHS